MLTISDEQYAGRLSDVANYIVVNQRCQEDQHSPEGYSWVEVSEEPLTDIRTRIETPLESGRYVEGWLRFYFDDLPKCPEEHEHEEWHIEFDHETGEEHIVEDFITNYLTTPATAVSIVLIDAYGKEHPRQVNLPRCRKGRAIRRKRIPNTAR